MSGYNPWFDHNGSLEPRFNFGDDLRFGEEGEQWVKGVWDGRWEVKTDRYRNGKMVVETHQNPQRRCDQYGAPLWVKSGLLVTRADWWVYVTAVRQSFLVVSVARLRRFVELNHESLHRCEFAARSDNPAYGYLLTANQVLELMVSRVYDDEEQL